MDTTTPLISQDSANNESATETGSEALFGDMVDKGTKLLDVLPMQTEFFLDLVNTNYSQETVDNYKRDLEILAAFILNNNLSFISLKKLDISKYVEFLRTGKYLTVLKKYKPTNVYGKVRGTGGKKKSSSNASRRLSMYSGRLSSRSVNRMLSAIRSYLRFLIDIDHQVPLPPDSIKLIKSEKKETQVAEFEELVHLVEAPETYEKKRKIRFRNRAMLEMLFSTGMRISELINLDRHDLKLTDNSHLGDSKIYIIGKGRKQRFVYLTPRCSFYLERYLQTRDDDFPALFIPYRGLRHSTQDPYVVRISVNYLQSKIKEYRTYLGIIVPTSAHSLRHGFATYIAENGANPAVIQRLLGHASLSTTSKYVHSSDKVAEQTHQKHHPLKDLSE